MKKIIPIEILTNFIFKQKEKGKQNNPHPYPSNPCHNSIKSDCKPAGLPRP